jgi:hypothetical protein
MFRPIPTLSFADAVGELASWGSFCVVSTLGPEERHSCGLQISSRLNIGKRIAISVEPVRGAFPDVSDNWLAAVQRAEAALHGAGLEFETVSVPLVATEDEILELARLCEEGGDRLIIDISCLPPRIFGLLISTLLRRASVRDLLVVYTEAGRYSDQRLTGDPLPIEPLPGFAGDSSEEKTRLVVSLGFESLGLQDFLDNYRTGSAAIKWLLPFPARPAWMRRQWSAIHGALDVSPTPADLEYVPAWDINGVYHAMRRWADLEPRLHLAPFGPKPHTLGMLLLARECGFTVSYSQPKSIRPDGSKGFGITWCYVLKRGGVELVAGIS